MSSTSSAIPDPPRPAPPSPESQALLRLSLVAGLRGTPVRKLLEAFGDAGQLAIQPWRRLAEALDGALAERLRQGPEALAPLEAQAEAWQAQAGNHVITLLDAAYPACLRQLPDPPLALWLKGALRHLGDPALAIVGSRRATPQGELDARAFAQHLGQHGLTVVSGLAEGIDGAAHRGALGTPGSTVAVLAHGLDRIYPPRHRELAHQIAAEGLLVSEYPLGTPALRHHFPERNRLISGLSLGVLVVEATLSSGSLLTARSALEQDREVMAMPGSIHSPLSKGCHRLIREGASLVESVHDVWALLAHRLGGIPALPAPAQTLDTAETLAAKVMSALLPGAASIDRIVQAIGLTALQVSSILGREELGGRVIRLADGRWQRLFPVAEIPPTPARDS